jgi:hypothetical protein
VLHRERRKQESREIRSPLLKIAAWVECVWLGWGHLLIYVLYLYTLFYTSHNILEPQQDLKIFWLSKAMNNARTCTAMRNGGVDTWKVNTNEMDSILRSSWSRSRRWTVNRCNPASSWNNTRKEAVVEMSMTW